MSLMKTGDTIDLIMNHEIKEMGKHMLVEIVFYTYLIWIEFIIMYNLQIICSFQAHLYLNVFSS